MAPAKATSSSRATVTSQDAMSVAIKKEKVKRSALGNNCNPSNAKIMALHQDKESCHKVLEKGKRSKATLNKKTVFLGEIPNPNMDQIPCRSQAQAQAQGVAIKPVRRISNQTEDPSGLEDVSTCGDSMRPAAIALAPLRRVPRGVVDFDQKNWDDPLQVSHYSMEIFNYLKTREPAFAIGDYMPRQIHLTTYMRAVLVDWMVEVQEHFRLYHETLYLAVKIVDLYLCRAVIKKENLQLLGITAFFIASKYDECLPLRIWEVLYICDGAYSRDELVKMELETLRLIQYDLGIPLSYSFLRRYARCAQVKRTTLTLARYILELSLMDYAAIGFRDSQMASAALYMALRMRAGASHLEQQTWTSTLVHYTGFQLAEFAEIVPVLNAGLHRRPLDTIKKIRNKYSDKIFHEVAKVPLLTNQELFQNNLAPKQKSRAHH
ncbi:G2/mitotic-specific cyclin-B3-like [Drosophila miranda]|uniref:G2/mitotic-specific cyclin-B3-like n=1 Tax=Drosophila miranda TaxID=7229 RepID=UPI00143F1102|nr:G2/mitotic-specific cyclin-B3-like [Drosophila miranda]